MDYECLASLPSTATLSEAMRDLPLRAAIILIVLASIGFACGSKRAKYAPPSDPPEPPDGEGWYCFHATSPHAISACKRDRVACDKARASYAADKTEMEEVSGKATSIAPVSVPKRFLATPIDEEKNEIEGDDAPPESEQQGQSLGTICSIDPAACSSIDIHRRSVPTYSTCASQKRAYCSAYYHEFNFYRDDENHWRHFCAETAKSCEAWRELWHLHLVKRPCELTP
jgi:hypothetical protein